MKWNISIGIYLVVGSLTQCNMNGLKQTYNLPKNNARYNKLKDSLKASSSRHKIFEISITDNETVTPTFPVLKQFDNGLLPRYAALLSRSSEDGVGMEDLDQLQQDLEKLLSTVAIRHRVFKLEIESIDRVEERRKSKKGKLYKKHQPLKRKKTDDRTKCRDIKNGRILKARHALPINNFVNDLPVKREVPKVSFPKNDTSDKFWLSIEPFCTDVTGDDVAFIDGLIQECSRNFDFKVPEVGDHYSIAWSDEMLVHERSLSSTQRSCKTKTTHINSELKKNGLNAMIDTFSSPLTQRLLAALIEEKVITKMPLTNEKLKPTDFCLAKNNGPRSGICMDRRLRKEFVEQGILDVEDLPKSIPPDDDILTEIKKCIQELKVVNEKNVIELNKLRTIIAKDLRRQEVKDALDKIDNQVMDMYNKILISKQKHTPQTDDETYDKLICPKLNFEEREEGEINKIIQQQVILHKELTELTNATIVL